MRQKFSLNELKTIVKNLVKEEMGNVPKKIKNNDPTREQMLSALQPNVEKWQSYGVEEDTLNWAVESAIYWFANDYHGGMNSNLYSVLSQSKYRPARAGSETSYKLNLEDPMFASMYMTLKNKFAR